MLFSSSNERATNERIIYPITAGKLRLQHRVVMAPATRMRTETAGVGKHTDGTYEGKLFPEPRALEEKEIENVIEEFRQAAIRAKAAGFDGVELHAANGYLPEQFLLDGSNFRQDEWGGSLSNRARFSVEERSFLIHMILR